MVQAVPAEEGDGHDLPASRAGVVQDADRGGWDAPWCGDCESCDLREVGEFAKTGSAYDSNVDRV